MTEKFASVVRIVRRRDVEKLTGLSRATIYDRLNPNSPRFDPAFPQPVRIGQAAVGWVLKEVEDWIRLKVELSRSVKVKI